MKRFAWIKMTIAAAGVAAWVVGCSRHEEAESGHEHGEACQHDHGAETAKAESDAKSEGKHDHEGEASCGGEHKECACKGEAGQGCAGEAEAGHAHGEACEHDHETGAAKAENGAKAEVGHAHEGEAACGDEHGGGACKGETGQGCAGEAEAGHAHGEACAHDQAEAGCSHEAGAAADGSSIELPEGAIKLLRMSFATATRRPVTGTVRFPGRFEWMPDATRAYPAAIGGRVDVKVRPAQRVKAGEVLFTVRSPEWAALLGEVREAEAAATLARAEADILRARLERLSQTGTRQAELEMALAVKEAEIDRAVRTVESAEQRRRAVLALCREEKGVLVTAADEAGVVSSLAVEDGAWVEAGTKVAVAVRPERIWFRADGLDAEMGAVRDGMAGFVEPLKGLEAADIRADGRLELGLALSDASRVRPLYLIPSRVEAWMVAGRQGVLSAKVDASAADAVAVPAACVVVDGLKSVVFERDAHDPDRFIKRAVIPGASDGDWVAVSGLEAGATVVLDGAYELKLAAPSASAPKKTAGHFHADGQFHEGKH